MKNRVRYSVGLVLVGWAATLGWADVNGVASLVAPGAEVVKLAGGFRFTEGPAADASGDVYFTDIPSQRIHIWSTEGVLSTFREDSGRANGLMFDPSGDLLVCEHADGRLVSIDRNGGVTVLADQYEGKRFNSPNDLWIDPKAGVYFTDPRYGNRDSMELDSEDVYYLSPDRKSVTRVIDDLVRPNGVIGTPDGKTLYVADQKGGTVYRYVIQPDGSLTGRDAFAAYGADGMTMDERENLYLAADVVRIFDPDGNALGKIEVPERPSNLCFGGPDGKTLFVTARTSLYSVRMTVGPARMSGLGSWTLLSCTGAPDARHETAFVELGGDFYMIGGRESQKIDRFDPVTNTWSKMGATSPLIHHFQPVVWDEKIYMVGAMTGKYPKEPPMTHVQIYDPATDEWTEGDEVPEARRRGGAGTVVYDGKIYMACGITLGHTSGTNNWFDAYDPATGTWTVLPDAPHKRDHFHAVVLDNKLYCMGGRDTSYHEPENFGAFFRKTVTEIDCYDFETGEWSALATQLPVGSAAGGVGVLDGKIIYFGGENADQESAVNKAWILDPVSETWTGLADMNIGRHGSQAVVYGGKVYIAGGSPKRGGGRTDTIEVFAY